MRILATVLVFASALHAVECYRSKSNLYHCGRHKFYNETSAQCEFCDLCGPGTFVKSRCKGSKDTECRNCPSGYFSTTYAKSPNSCRRCNDCGMREVIRSCTSISDAVCGDCPLGTYWDYVKYTCTACSYCFPEYQEDAAIEPLCENPRIPVTHRCAEALWTPYKPPRLILQVDEDGEITFISSKDVQTSKFVGAESTASKTISTQVDSTAATSTPSHTYSTKDSNASLGEVLSKFTKLYNTHCTRTLIFASAFCICVLLVAFIGLCVIAQKRPRFSTPDRKGLLENDA